VQDPYGHGTHVASIAAGTSRYYGSSTPDSTGIAPGASVYDVRVLDDAGAGTLSDALQGIQWVIFHAKEYNIKVLNVSLAANSPESWLTDPLCVAVRSAAAAGITVVVARQLRPERPSARDLRRDRIAGIDPSVITVGAVNFKGTLARSDDSVNLFSSRGRRAVDGRLERRASHRQPAQARPRRSRQQARRCRGHDGREREPDLERPRFVVLRRPRRPARHRAGLRRDADDAERNVHLGAGRRRNRALMLQTTPGLTPPLIKAILQYTAQPLPNANLLQQGAGLLNVDGAIQLARHEARPGAEDRRRRLRVGAGHQREPSCRRRRQPSTDRPSTGRGSSTSAATTSSAARRCSPSTRRSGTRA
jgi:hypothetical protein